MSREPADASTTGISIALCTVPAAEAETLVDALLDERLIACANLIGPVRSRYRWQGAVEESEEIVLLLKLQAANASRLQDRIAALHSYDCPEVLFFAVDGGLPAYLDWVRGEAGG